MGIQGLLPFVKKSSRPVNLKEFSGQTAAVDAYCWLHKGAFSCAEKLVKGEPTNGYVTYVMKYVNLLLNNNIKPILVFDGCSLPSKAITETKRRENRIKNRKKAKEFLLEGKLREAKECFQRCVEVTSAMAHEVIVACRMKNVDTIVAPYEADTQLAYFTLKNVAHFVITEDSDLLLFGCEKVLFKLDSNGGGILVEKHKLHLSMNLPLEKYSFDKFVNMCILSGCDYLPSLHGIGLSKACKFFCVTTNPDTYKILQRLPSYLNMPNLDVTEEYREGFMKALNTFKYQLVFDPFTRMLKPLNPYAEGVNHKDFPYAGAYIDDEKALQIALGNMDIQTFELVDNYSIENYKTTINSKTTPKMPSIWDKDISSVVIKKEPHVPKIYDTAIVSTSGKQSSISICIKRKTQDDDARAGLDFTEIYGNENKKTCSEGLTTCSKEAVITSDENKEKGCKSLKIMNPFAKFTSSKVNNYCTKKSKFSALTKFTELNKSKTIVKSKYFAGEEACQLSVISNVVENRSVFNNLKDFGEDNMMHNDMEQKNPLKNFSNSFERETNTISKEYESCELLKKNSLKSERNNSFKWSKKFSMKENFSLSNSQSANKSFCSPYILSQETILKSSQESNNSQDGNTETSYSDSDHASQNSLLDVNSFDFSQSSLMLSQSSACDALDSNNSNSEVLKQCESNTIEVTSAPLNITQEKKKPKQLSLHMFALKRKV